jgi:cytochrome c peroxidase
MNRILFVVLIGFIVFQACRKDDAGYDPTPYALDIPPHFPDMPIPADNPMTVEGVELGRRLFYETMLSGDNSMSCASCHAPANAFSDPEQYSTGIDGIQGTRNSMALVNLGWQTSFFWDGRAQTLEQQILEPVPNPVEMHQSWTKAVSLLKTQVRYRNLFYQAYGTTDFDSTHVAKAIAQFLRTMISGKSKFDVIYKWENSIPFTGNDQQIWQTVTAEELGGYDLFKSLNGADCFHCHNGPLMQVNKFSNNGLDAVFTDLGRGAVNGNPADNGKFKVPTLRNIALTAPYMHDGRFETLDDVIEHYSTGVHQSETIDPLMESAHQGGVQLDPEQRQLLKAFLLTLTDQDFVTNPNFQPLNP